MIQGKVNLNEKLPHRKGTEEWIHSINTLICHDLIEDDTYKDYRITAPPFEGYFVSGTRINNLFHGDVEIYDPNRQKVADIKFHDGIANGYCSLYDAYGKLFFRGLVRDGFIYRGEIYNRESELSLIGVFSRGNLIGELIHGPKSRLFKERNVDGDIAAIYAVDRHYYRDGICYRYNKNMITDICIFSKESELREIKTFSEGAMIEKNEFGVVSYKGGYVDSFEEKYARQGNGTQYDATGIHITYQGQFWQNKRFGMGSSFKNGSSEPSYEGLWCFNLPYKQFIAILISILVIAIIATIVLFLCSGWCLGVIFLVVFAIIAMIVCIQIRKTLFRFPLLLTIDIESTMKTPFDLALIHPFTTKLLVAENSCNKLQNANFSAFNQLKNLSVNKNSLKNLVNFELTDLRQLESVSIASNCCCDAELGQNASQLVRKFTISNCCALKSINIMNSSFVNYKSMQLSRLPSLQTISIGNGCFKSVAELKINNLTSLTSITIGSNCFTSTKIAHIIGNPALVSISIRDDCFPNVNEYTIQSNAKLASIDIRDNCFTHLQSFSLARNHCFCV